MKQSIIKILKMIGIADTVRYYYKGSIHVFWRLFGFLSCRNRRFFKKYQKKNKTHKIHLGCGTNVLDGWINTDIRPHQDIISLDVTKPFFFPDNSFDYAFSEHVIEHIPYLKGQNMIQETFRILKPEGIFRLVTPDFMFLLNLYQDDTSPLHKSYIEWNAQKFIKDKAPHSALSVVNNYVRDWGHIYIYDIPTLKKALKEYGFENIKIFDLKKSDHKQLENLEHDSRHPDGFLALESLVIEAQKPAA